MPAFLVLIIIAVIACLPVGIILWVKKKAVTAGKILILIPSCLAGFIIWAITYDAIYWRVDNVGGIMFLVSLLIVAALATECGMFFGFFDGTRFQVTVITVIAACVVLLMGMFGQEARAAEIGDLELQTIQTMIDF